MSKVVHLLQVPSTEKAGITDGGKYVEWINGKWRRNEVIPVLRICEEVAKLAAELEQVKNEFLAEQEVHGHDVDAIGMECDQLRERVEELGNAFHSAGEELSWVRTKLSEAKEALAAAERKGAEDERARLRSFSPAPLPGEASE